MNQIIYTGDAPEKEIFQIFSETMSELIEEDHDTVYIDADLMSSMRSKDLWKKYPDNVINTGIQEANMIGVAAGMYLYGKKPYVHSFAPFASRRCFDQIYLSIGYAGKGIRIIGSEPGICATDNGGTHMTFEDIAMMRTIPGACVIDISDGGMFGKLLRETKDRDGVIYFRTPRRGLPDVYSSETEFKIGEGKIVKYGTDCTVIASGIMLSTAIKASKVLSEMGIEVEIIDPVTIKPLDKELVISSASKTNRVITVENHSVHGGLGSAVAELLSCNFPTRMDIIGINEEFGQVGNEAYLREQYHLTSEEIVKRVRNILEV